MKFRKYPNHSNKVETDPSGLFFLYRAERGACLMKYYRCVTVRVPKSKVVRVTGFNSVRVTKFVFVRVTKLKLWI